MKSEWIKNPVHPVHPVQKWSSPAVAPFMRVTLSIIGLLLVAASARGDDFDRPPINYATTDPTDAIARLQKRLDAGELKLKFVDEHGYLPAVLKALDIPTSSQMLVFSKTSMQRDRISPRTPRALYFNDDVYVGFCRLGNVLEVAATDPQLGPVYYTLDQEPAARPTFRRQTENCLICHRPQPGDPAHRQSVFTTARDTPFFPRGRTGSTTPARSNTAGAGGTSPGLMGPRPTWGTTSSPGDRRPAI